MFWKFKTWIENQSGYRIKVIRCDNGIKYTTDKFVEFCEVVGIEHQLTTTYTPQQNGVSERKNMIIMEMARCLVFEKEMPKILWAEAVNTTIFMLNRLPTKVLKGKTPMEAWYGLKPSIHNLNILVICVLLIFQMQRGRRWMKRQNMESLLDIVVPTRVTKFINP